MKNLLRIILACFVAASLHASDTPIKNGTLQSDLKANHYKIILANLADYAGANLTWNVVTNKFDASGGGTLPDPLRVTHTPAANTTNTGLILESTNTSTSGNNRWAPAQIFTQHFFTSADNRLDMKIEAKDGMLVIGQSSVNGGAYGPGLAYYQSGGVGYLTDYNGDTGIIVATVYGLDTVQTGGDGGHPSRVAMFNDSTPSVPGLGMGNNGEIWWDSGAVFSLLRGDTGLNRVAAGVLKLRNVLQLTPLGSAPGSPSEGFLYGNSGDHTLRYYNGTTFQKLNLVIGTDVQAWDADLDTWATLTPSANFQTMVPHTFAQMRTDLGLVIGTNVEAWDVDLDNLAAITGNSKFAFRNGSGVWQARGLGTNLTDDGTNINAASGGTIGGSIASGQVAFGSGSNTITGDPLFTYATTTGLKSAANDAVTNNITDTLTVGHNSTGTAVNGFGTGILFTAEDSTTNDVTMAAIRAAWTNVTHNSNAAYIQFAVDNGGGPSLNAPMRFDGGLGVGTTTTGGAGVINAASGFWAGNTAPGTTGKFLQAPSVSGAYSNSSYSFPTIMSNTNANEMLMSDGTNVVTYPRILANSSTAAQSSTFATDTYITNSNIAPPAAADIKAKGQYHCVFDMTKTNVGTATPIITVRFGTNGTTADAAVLQWTLGAGTAAVDTAVIEIWATFRSVGPSTSAVLQGTLKILHTAATGTGLTSTADKALTPFAVTTSAGFATTPSGGYIGVSFNGGSSFSGTVQQVQATLIQP